MGGEDEFYLRYYVGHKGKFGHEFLEFEVRPDGRLRYANNSNYKNDKLIRKEMFVSPEIIKEVQRIIADSEITKEDDREWPEADRCETKENNARVPNPKNQKKPTHYSMALSEVVAPERWKTDHSAGADRPTTPSTSPVRPCRAVDEDRGFRSAPPRVYTI